MNWIADEVLTEVLGRDDGAIGRLHEADAVTVLERDPTVARRP